MPIPVVKDAGKDVWHFDVAAGKDEILNRRIGRNELDTIQVCMAIVDAQREYAIRDPDGAGLPVYASKFLSDPGRKNGLYWETKKGEPPSPLGNLMATARRSGLPTESGHENESPSLSWLLLPNASRTRTKRQRGQLSDYRVGSHMFDGFAVVAFPATYGNSGIMTFIVNQDGVVYQSDLDANTVKTAESMTAFDPDANWKKLDAPEPEKP